MACQKRWFISYPLSGTEKPCGGECTAGQTAGNQRKRGGCDQQIISSSGAIPAEKTVLKSSRAVPFEKLPDECQTVVASVAHQYGNLSTRTPHFWHQCTTGDWHDAYNNLMHFGDHYTDRRHKEAHLLGKCLGK